MDQNQEIVLEKKKHPQYIIAIDAEYCRRFFKPGFNALSLDEFINGLVATRHVTRNGESKVVHYQDDLASRVVLRERYRLEFDKNFLQPLNYMVLRQDLKKPYADPAGFSTFRTVPHFSTYYRVKGGGEDRLLDKMSIGWGGHTDWNMIGWDEKGAIEYRETARINMMMEIGQECRFRFVGTNQEYESNALVAEHLTFKGFIWDPSDDVGQHHLALVWEVAVPDSVTLESREDEQKLGPWSNRGELMAQKVGRADLFENWSNIVIDEICKDSWDYLGRLGKSEEGPEVPDQSERSESAIDWPEQTQAVQAETSTHELAALASELGPKA